MRQPLLLILLLINFTLLAQNNFSPENYNVTRNDLETNIFKIR